MKTVSWVVMLSSLQLVAGCATSGSKNPQRVELEELVVDVAAADTDAMLETSTSMDTALSGTDVIGTVVASADRDFDGIVDSLDNCADSSSGVMVDATGCEIVMGAIEGLKFSPGSSKLNSDARTSLNKYVDALQRYPEVVVSVEGHTDNRGSASDNLELSKKRVLAVVEYMVSNGINPSRLKAFGYGESRPRAANATASGREQNRRIEIKVLTGLL
ncbi:MAG: OmpA family protein [Granulosicoccus sp.]